MSNEIKNLSPEDLSQVSGGANTGSKTLKEVKYGPSAKCPYCGSNNIQQVGDYILAGTRYLKYHCHSCSIDYSYNPSSGGYSESNDALF